MPCYSNDFVGNFCPFGLGLLYNFISCVFLLRRNDEALASESGQM